MNALGDRCRSVIILVEGKEVLDADAWSKARGFHCGVVIPNAGGSRVSPQRLISDINAFGAEHRVAVTQKTTEDTLSHSAPLPAGPLTAITCTAAQLPSLVSHLLAGDGQYANGEAYALVAVLDLSRDHSPPPSPEADALAWLRPTPSYLSELCQRNGGVAPCDLAVVPVHMFSAFPVIRDSGCTADSVLHNLCTFDALLGELAFKAGQLPKYGA